MAETTSWAPRTSELRPNGAASGSSATAVMPTGTPTLALAHLAREATMPNAPRAPTPTKSHALVEVVHASAARRAAVFQRRRAAARPAPHSSAVISGSATVSLDVNRNTGLSERSVTATTPCRRLAARR